MRPIGVAPTGGRLLTPVTAPLEGERLDPARLAFLPGIDVGQVARLMPGDLVPMFALDLHRTVWQLQWGETQLSLTLERVAVEAGAGTLAPCQIELALQAGPAQGLYEFATKLHRAVPFRLATHDAVQQAYRLVAGEDWWRVEPGAAPAIHAHMSVEQGILAIGRAAVSDVRVEIDGLDLTMTVDQIHRARVALRRLRSVLSVFGKALPDQPRRALSKDLSAMAGALGQAREWDVFVADTLTPLLAALGEERGLKGLGFTAAVLRERAAADALAAVGASDFMGLSLRLAAWFDAGLWPEPPSPEAATLLAEPLGRYATALLRKGHKRFLAAGNHLADASAVELHGLRIDAKRLRYITEFCRPLFCGQGYPPLCRGLARHPGYLGHAQRRGRGPRAGGEAGRPGRQARRPHRRPGRRLECRRNRDRAPTLRRGLAPVREGPAILEGSVRDRLANGLSSGGK